MFIITSYRAPLVQHRLAFRDRRPMHVSGDEKLTSQAARWIDQIAKKTTCDNLREFVAAIKTRSIYRAQRLLQGKSQFDVSEEQFRSKFDAFNSGKTKARRKRKKKSYNEQVEVSSIKPQQKRKSSKTNERPLITSNITRCVKGVKQQSNESSSFLIRSTILN